jgi:hypothetical protein
MGRELEVALNAEGYTMGHEPDSYEFSTLGPTGAHTQPSRPRNAHARLADPRAPEARAGRHT